ERRPQQRVRSGGRQSGPRPARHL
ncbi:MAG: hypothetical protein AVDCRST_MAG48-810, partial [uncultured Friedmanniella sp.]